MVTAEWLLKDPRVVRGTWWTPGEAVTWLGGLLTRHAPGFLSPREADPVWLDRLAGSARETLGWGGDVSLGFYVGATSFLSLALVTCSPNLTAPDLPCPTAPSRRPPG